MNEILQILNSLRAEVEQIKSSIENLSKPVPCHSAGTWLDGQDVLLLLHISKRSLQKLRDNGVLPYSRINGKFYYKQSDIEQLLENNYCNSFTGKTFNHFNNSKK